MVDVDEAGPAEIDIPAGAIYLVHDPDHGEDLKNLSPQEALTDIAARDRSPMLLTEARSEEHTSELQSRGHLVCRLLLEKKKISGDHAMSALDPPAVEEDETSVATP